MSHFKNRLLGTAAGVLSVTFRLGRGKGGGGGLFFSFLIVYDAKRVKRNVCFIFVWILKAILFYLFIYLCIYLFTHLFINSPRPFVDLYFIYWLIHFPLNYLFMYLIFLWGCIYLSIHVLFYFSFFLEGHMYDSTACAACPISGLPDAIFLTESYST